MHGTMNIRKKERKKKEVACAKVRALVFLLSG